MQGGSFLFPITPVFNSSLQYSHNQSISLISKPQDQGTIILSPSLYTSTCHIRSRAPHTTHTHPQQASQLQRNPTKIVDDIQAHDLFDQSQISTMVSDHTDHRPKAGLTRLSHVYACKYLIYQQTTPRTRVRGSTHRERCKSSNSELNKNEQRSIACGGEFKVTGRI